MLILKGTKTIPWWIELETEDNMIALHHMGRPYIDTEAGKDLYVEQLVHQAKIQGIDLKAIHVWPLAWGEVS